MTRSLASFSISVEDAMTDITVNEDCSIQEALEYWALHKFLSTHDKADQYIGTAIARATLVMTKTGGPTFEVEVYDPTYD